MKRIAFVCFSMVVACGSNGKRPDDVVAVPSTPETLVVDVGTGEFDFQELAPGDPVTLVHGAQGGYHVWTAIRVHDAALRDVRVNLSSRFEDGTPGGTASGAAASLVPGPEATASAAGLRNFVQDAQGARDKKLVLRVEVVAADQRHGSAEKLVTVVAK